MIFTSLKLNSFRSYQYLDIRIASRIVVLYGGNGSGKSNLLEAVHVANFGHSFRTQDTKELIRFDQVAAELNLGYLDNLDVQHTVWMRIPASGRRVLQKDGQSRAVSKHRVFCGPLVTCWVHNAKIVSGEPASRRAFLDEEIPGLHPQYGSDLEAYRRIVDQKNKLLREEGLTSTQKGRQIRIWNEQLATHGAKLLAARLRFLSEIRPMVGEYYTEVAGEGPKIGIAYSSRCELSEHIDEAAAGEVLASELAKNLERELVIGQSIRGPHRDDIMLTMDGKEARDYASEGQVRSLAICLKLAVRDLLERTLGEAPVLLVDDVGSELDPDRRDRAVRLLAEKGQVFMACQDRSAFVGPLGDRTDETTIWEIRDGTVTVAGNG